MKPLIFINIPIKELGVDMIRYWNGLISKTLSRAPHWSTTSGNQWMCGEGASDQCNSHKMGPMLPQWEITHLLAPIYLLKGWGVRYILEGFPNKQQEGSQKTCNDVQTKWNECYISTVQNSRASLTLWFLVHLLEMHLWVKSIEENMTRVWDREKGTVFLLHFCHLIWFQPQAWGG